MAASADRVSLSLSKSVSEGQHDFFGLVIYELKAKIQDKEGYSFSAASEFVGHVAPVSVVHERLCRLQ